MDIFQERLRKIKILFTDVDGVLTDGGMYYTEDGLAMKRFNVKDGMGSVLLREAGIKTGIITSDGTPIAKVRAQRLKFDYIYIAVKDKKVCLEEILEATNLKGENIAYIGDDVNDLSIMELAGLTFCPADACKKIKDVVDYVSEFNGGYGVYREVVDLILSANSDE